jgi:hypothetical protein
MIIGVQNLSTRVSDDDTYTMTLLVNRQARDHVAPAWGLLPPTVRFIPKSGPSSKLDALIGILDDADQAGDLGWHTEGPSAAVYGRVFAAPVLANGGNTLTADLSVCSVLSHEVIETLGDPACNRWAQRNDGTLIAVELCDPVESDSYSLSITAPGETVSGTVSDFVLPAWFDEDSASGNKDYLGLVTSAFSIRPAGYVVEMQETDAEIAVWGEKYPGWRKETKASETARTARRISVGKPQTSLA